MRIPWMQRADCLLKEAYIHRLRPSQLQSARAFLSQLWEFPRTTPEPPEFRLGTAPGWH